MTVKQRLTPEVDIAGKFGETKVGLTPRLPEKGKADSVPMKALECLSTPNMSATMKDDAKNFENRGVKLS